MKLFRKMAQFGFVLDEDLVLKKRIIYSLFSNYFGDPVMTKIKDQNIFSMYAARKNVLLRNFNYLIVLTRRDFKPIWDKVPPFSIEMENVANKNIRQ